MRAYKGLNARMEGKAKAATQKGVSAGCGCELFSQGRPLIYWGDGICEEK